MSQDEEAVFYNQQAWDRKVDDGNRWTLPASAEEVAAARLGEVRIVLTPTIYVPASWLGDLKGRRVLCLAGSGGQQAPLLAAAGAEVTVLDFSARQLDQDRLVAARERLSIDCQQGDMRDLSRFQDGSFELIVHPISNCFVPSVLAVWQECQRVLESGGELLAGFVNPTTYLFDPRRQAKGELVVRYAIPYCDSDHFSAEEHRELFGENEPVEFGHSLNDQIGGQLRAGLMLVDMFEDEHSADDPERLPSEYFKPYMATRSRKL